MPLLISMMALSVLTALAAIVLASELTYRLVESRFRLRYRLAHKHGGVGPDAPSTAFEPT